MQTLGELLFVGLGLFDEKDISLRGLEEIKSSDVVFAECYTSLMPNLQINRLEEFVGKKVNIVSRHVLEEENGQPLLEEAKKSKVAFLVPGDPMVATTHLDLRIRAEKQGVDTRVIHGASIVSAAIGLSGLQNYRFGKSVTVTFPQGTVVSESSYKTILENQVMGLHTLCLLDLKAEEKRYMTIKDALQLLLTVEKRIKKHVVTLNTLVVGIARAGSTKPIVKGGYLGELIGFDFGVPPHTLVFPSHLHFMEAEALITLANTPESIREAVK